MVACSAGFARRHRVVIHDPDSHSSSEKRTRREWPSRQQAIIEPQQLLRLLPPVVSLTHSVSTATTHYCCYVRMIEHPRHCVGDAPRIERIDEHTTTRVLDD